MQFPQAEVSAVKKLIEVSKNIVITTHHRPDGDAMGSSLGLYNYLKLLGCSVNIITPSDYPDFLNWLSSNDIVVNFEYSTKQAKELISQANLIFCLDFNWLSRVEAMEMDLRNSSAKKVLIDHHLDPEKAFDHVFSFTEACSTCELIHRFIDASGNSNMINKDIAECLYCGIMTDTNSFRYSSMKADVHRIRFIYIGIIERGIQHWGIR